MFRKKNQIMFPFSSKADDYFKIALTILFLWYVSRFVKIHEIEEKSKLVPKLTISWFTKTS